MRGLIFIIFFILNAFNGMGHAAMLSVPGDYTTIQAAIDAAQPGDTISVGKGYYSEHLRMRAGIRLEGAEKGESIVRGDASETPLLTAEECDGAVISRMTFIHNGLAPPKGGSRNSYVVFIVDSALQIQHCRFVNGPGVGLMARSSRPVLVEACAAESNAIYGVCVMSEGVEQVVKDCVLWRNGRAGLSFVCGPGPCGTAEGNICQENGVGIEVSGPSSAPSLNRNTCSSNKGAGIAIINGAYGSCMENICSYNGGAGIHLSDIGSQNYLLRNHVKHNAGHGIQFSWGTGGVAEDNTCSGNGGSGIYLMSGSSVQKIIQNQCENNAYQGIFVGEGLDAVLDKNPLLLNGVPDTYRIRCMVGNEDFAGLESIAHSLRDKKIQDPSGCYSIFHFYRAVTQGWGECKLDNRENYLAFLQRWRAKYPESITPRAAELDACIQYAWKERGSGFVNEVSAKQWEGFHHYMDLAAGTVSGYQGSDEMDPVYHTNLAAWFMARSYFAGSVIAVMNGLKEYPRCAQLIGAAINTSMPRWGGNGDRDDLMQCCDYIISISPEEDRDAVYALCAAEIEHRGEDLTGLPLDWPRVNTGMRQLAQARVDNGATVVRWLRLARWKASREETRAIFDEFAPTEEAVKQLSDDPYDIGHMLTLYQWAMAESNTPLPPRELPLCAALKKGDMDRFHKLIETDVDINLVNTVGIATLHVVVSRNDVASARILLAHGADPNLPRLGVSTPLCIAVNMEHWEMAELLLQHGADPEGRQYNDATSLILAVERQNLDMIRLLLANKANPSTASSDGWSSLHAAVAKRSLPIVQLLLESGADINAVRVTTGETPLSMSVARNMPEIAEVLLRADAKASPPDCDGWARSALHWAVARGTLDTVRLLLDSGAVDIAATDFFGDTPLHTAVRLTKADMIAELLKHGAPVDKKNSMGKTPLERARAALFTDAVTLMESGGR